MKMKRLLALLLALLMAFSLFACGDDDYYYEDDDDDDEKSSQKGDRNDDDDDTTDPTGDATDPTGDATDPTGDATEPTEGGNNGTPVLPPSSGNNTNTQQPSTGGNDVVVEQPSPNPNNPNTDNNNGSPVLPEQPEEPTEPAVNTILGRWEGATYINEYADFQVTFDSTWAYHAVDSSIDPARPFASGTQQFFDVNASASSGSTISVTYQNPTAYNGGIKHTNTEEQNIDLILNEEATLRAAYEGMGMTVNFLGKDYITFAGQTHCVLKTIVSYYTIEMHIVQLYTYGSDTTPVLVTMSGMSANDLQTLINMFSPA